MAGLSSRLRAIVDALPLREGLAPGEARYDLAFAVRVGAFDGRYPRAGELALQRLSHALVPGGRLFIDGREVTLPIS